ncbi:MAG: amino acid transporter [Anaerolineaceae bacterium]
MSFSAETVLAVIDLLAEAGCWRTIDGGWGVDALTGHQTRDHEDLDLVVKLNEVDDVLRMLGGLGFFLDLDLRPTRVVAKHADGRWVDLHPLEFDSCGTGWQRGAGAHGSDCAYPADGFSEGTVAGRTVPCLSAALQITHHQGYEADEKDHHDLDLLRQRL